MPDELPCPSKWKEVDGTAKGTGHGTTKAAARTSARGRVFTKAFEELRGILAAYACADDCGFVVDMTVERAALAKPKQAPNGGYDCSGESDWVARYRCDHKEVPAGAPQQLERQDLDCEERAVAHGTANGTGEDADRDTASERALADLSLRLGGTLEVELYDPDPSGIGADSKVHCPDECPDLALRVRTDQPKVACQAPAEEGGNWKCTASQAWYLRVRCRS